RLLHAGRRLGSKRLGELYRRRGSRRRAAPSAARAARGLGGGVVRHGATVVGRDMDDPPTVRKRAGLQPDGTCILACGLPAYLQDFFTVAYEYGTRKGQLARTLRRYVSLGRGVIEWPPSECKHQEGHVVPLEGEVLAIIERLTARPPLHCPYVFHGPRCAPGAKPSEVYGCIGDFKKAWR